MLADYRPNQFLLQARHMWFWGEFVLHPVSQVIEYANALEPLSLLRITRLCQPEEESAPVGKDSHGSRMSPTEGFT
jgi:hypothetical protein